MHNQVGLLLVLLVGKESLSQFVFIVLDKTFALFYFLDWDLWFLTGLLVFGMITCGLVFASLAHRAPDSATFGSASELLLPSTLLLVFFAEAFACPRILAHYISWASLGLHDFCRSETDLRIATNDLIGAIYPHFSCSIIVPGLVFRILLFAHHRHKLVVECLILVLHLCFAFVSYIFNYFLVGPEFSQITLLLNLPIRVLGPICQASNVIRQLFYALLDFLLWYLAHVVVFNWVDRVWNWWWLVALKALRLEHAIVFADCVQCIHFWD